MDPIVEKTETGCSVLARAGVGCDLEKACVVWRGFENGVHRSVVFPRDDQGGLG